MKEMEIQGFYDYNTEIIINGIIEAFKYYNSPNVTLELSNFPVICSNCNWWIRKISLWFERIWISISITWVYCELTYYIRILSLAMTFKELLTTTKLLEDGRLFV